MAAQSPTVEVGDAELADEARSGDAGALTALVRRYQGTLLRFAKSLTRGEAVSPDKFVARFWKKARGT